MMTFAHLKMRLSKKSAYLLKEFAKKALLFEVDINNQPDIKTITFGYFSP